MENLSRSKQCVTLIQVDNDCTPKKIPKDEKEMSQLIFASGDLPVEDKSTNSDLDSSCDSPVFPSSLGRTEEGDGVGSSPTLNLYVGESPTLHKKIEDSEFTRPFPVVNKIPIGSEVKSCTSGQRRQQDGSPMQLPSTATSDPAVCSAQAGVADSGSVVESPEGSTGFEPKMHSTQIGGKSCHDDSFPSLHLDMSQQVGGDCWCGQLNINEQSLHLLVINVFFLVVTFIKVLIHVLLHCLRLSSFPLICVGSFFPTPPFLHPS